MGQLGELHELHRHDDGQQFDFLREHRVLKVKNKWVIGEIEPESTNELVLNRDQPKQSLN